MKKNITVLLGTARKGNNSEKVANFVVEHLNNKDDVEAKLEKVEDYLSGSTNGDDNITKKWKEVISNTDGLIIVSPEYNHGFPGELKILLDSLYDEYKGIPAGIVGVSAGTFAGARMIEMLKIVLHTLNFKICLDTGNFGPVSQVFGDDGKINSESKEKYEEQVDDLLKDLLSKLQ